MAVLEQVATHDEGFRTLRRDMRRGVAERAVRFIASLQRKGIVPATVDPRYAATALTGMVDRFAYVWLVLEEDFDEAEVVENLTRSGSRPSAAARRLRRPRPGRSRRLRLSRPISFATIRADAYGPADDAACGEVGDLVVGHAEHLAQDLRRVLAEQRRRTRPGASACRDACHGGPATGRVPASGCSSSTKKPRSRRCSRRRDLVHRAHRGRRDARRHERGDGVVARRVDRPARRRSPRARPRCAWRAASDANGASAASSGRPMAAASAANSSSSCDGDGDPRVLAVGRERAVRAIRSSRVPISAGGRPSALVVEHAPRQGARSTPRASSTPCRRRCRRCAAGTARRSCRWRRAARRSGRAGTSGPRSARRRRAGGRGDAGEGVDQRAVRELVASPGRSRRSPSSPRDDVAG